MDEEAKVAAAAAGWVPKQSFAKPAFCLQKLKGRVAKWYRCYPIFAICVIACVSVDLETQMCHTVESLTLPKTMVIVVAALPQQKQHPRLHIELEADSFLRRLTVVYH